MRDPVRRLLSVAALAFAAIALPACVEADMQTELREDGSGTLGVSMKFTEKTVEILNRMKKLENKDSQQDLMKAMDDFPKMPDEALAAELAKGGLKVVDCSATSNEKEIGARFKVEFQSVPSLAMMKRLESMKGTKKADTPADSIKVTRDEKGVYTLAFDMQPDTGDGEATADAGEMELGGEEEEPAGEAVDPEKAAEQMQEAMALAGELMGEASKLKFVVGLKVPGEVVDHFPKAGAKVEGSKVTWTMDFGTMMQMGMQGATDPEGNRMRVLFRMPEGKSLPESALATAEKKETPPAPPAMPPSPMPPAPGPEGPK